MAAEKLTQDDWVQLGAYVYDLVAQKLTDSLEFKALVAIYGRDKLRDLYRAERRRRSLGDGVKQ